MSNIDDLKEELAQQRLIMERFCRAALNYPQICEERGHQDEDTLRQGARIVNLRNQATARFEDIAAALEEDQGISTLILQSDSFAKLQNWISGGMVVVMSKMEALEIPHDKPYTGEITKIFFESEAALEPLYTTFVENRLGGGMEVGAYV